MSVSIVMPCYNEEKSIEKVIVDYYHEIIDKIDDSEFIVVDDCSNDQTPHILSKMQNKFPKLRILKPDVNGGHGKAIRLGYETAKKEWVFQVDSDNQFKSKDFWLLYELTDKYDFILGFRKKRHDPAARLVLTKLIRLVNYVLFRVWIKDANCPFRVIKGGLLREALKRIDKETLAPNIMVSILMKINRIKMAEVPIAHYERKTGVVSLQSHKLIKFVIKGFRQLMQFKKNLRLWSWA